MVSSDLRGKREEDDRPNMLSPPTIPSGAAYSNNGYPTHGGPLGNGPEVDVVSGSINRYTLMVAGQRTGKTSFLRLLLDTSDISPAATKDQLASVAKFVQGCSSHTAHIRTVAIDVELGSETQGAQQRLALTLVDTPSLDFRDEPSSERLVQEMLRHIDSRFAEGVDDDWMSQTGDHHVHLCIYFLDPDVIVPPSVPGPPAPLVPRARTNSFSQPEPEPVILEPPVTTNPLLFRPTLPQAEIDTIRRLSARVNVLPVVARADTLTNDRLAAVKMAIRRDLADAGIGFGIFDIDAPYSIAQDEHLVTPINGDMKNGYHGHLNGSSSSTNSPPTSPATAGLLRLPYALISPDIYSHSDGVARIPLSRHELVLQYTPSAPHPAHNKFIRGKYVRNYRWGSMDVLDPHHSDFLHLRAAIFHHMETLQKYTREYLFDKFRAEYHQHQHAPSHLSMSHHVTTRSHLPLSHASRPILAIDTAPSHPSANRHPSLSLARDAAVPVEMRSAPLARPITDSVPSNSASVKALSSGPRSSRQRAKKITVACNFCRSRKLKCDGGRPACSQCVKRSNPCDYMPQNKRRGTMRQRKGDESDSDSEDRSGEQDEPSMSPEVPSLPLSRRSSNVERHTKDTFAMPFGGPPDRREELPSISAPRRASGSRLSPAHSEPISLFKDNELPHIATLSLPPETSPSTPMSAPSLPPIRPASEQQAAQRKRAATVPGNRTRQPSSSGPKVVACNFCRARKTKCDGAHPACSSCARRSLPCNYVHDTAAPHGPSQKRGARRTSSSKMTQAGSAKSDSPSSSSHIPHLISVPMDGYPHHHEDIADDGSIDLKRPSDSSEVTRPPKKMRMESSPMMADIP